MRHRVLLVAAELDLRAKFARELHSSGYAVELACDMKRALTLAADYHFRVAIVAPGPSPASLAMILTLRDTVPKMIVVAEGPDEIARLRHSLPGVDEFILKSADEGALATRVSEMIALADSAAGEHVSVPSIVYIGDCKLDLGGYVFVTPNGQEVALTRAESDLLKELVRNPCQVVSRDKLRYAVAGRGADPFDRSMDMLVTRVRRKIEPDPKVPQFLLSVPGVGYKLLALTQPAEARQFRAEPSEPERRQITALCCKLVGAMGLAVEVDPEDLSRVTKNFQDAAVAAITGMGGTIATVAPDEIQAFFGYPEAHEDDAERAVTAGTRRSCKNWPARLAKRRAAAGAGGRSDRLGASQSQANGRGTFSYCRGNVRSGGPQLCPRHCEYPQIPQQSFRLRESGAIRNRWSFRSDPRLPRDSEARGRVPFQRKAPEQSYPPHRPRPGTAAVVGTLGSNQAR